MKFFCLMKPLNPNSSFLLVLSFFFIIIPLLYFPILSFNLPPRLLYFPPPAPLPLSFASSTFLLVPHSPSVLFFFPYPSVLSSSCFSISHPHFSHSSFFISSFLLFSSTSRSFPYPSPLSIPSFCLLLLPYYTP